MNIEEMIEKIKAYYVLNDDDKIIDYITNLQQENQQLKEKINKAIEYIKKANYGTIYTIKGSKWYEILNILEGNNEY